MGYFGGSSVRSLSFFLDRSIYRYILLVLAVSYTIKNYCIQLEGWLRIRLTFDLLVVVIFRIYEVRQGLIGGLAKPLI